MRAALAGCILATAAGAPGPLAAATAAPVHELATREFRRLIVVPVRIGGSSDLEFVLDSGSAATTLNDLRLAERLGLHARPLGTAPGAGDSRLLVLMAPDVALTAGGRPLLRTDLLVHHVTQLHEEHAGRDLHGLLGVDLFARYAVDLDPSAGVVRLYPPSTPPPFPPTAVVPISIRRGKPIVRAEVTMNGARPVVSRLLLDTGSEAALVLVHGARRRLKAPAGGRTVRVTGVGGEVEGVLAHVDSVGLDGRRVGPLEAAFVERGSLPTVRELRRVDGVLGNGLLRRFRTWIDLASGRLVLGPGFENGGAATTGP